MATPLWAIALMLSAQVIGALGAIGLKVGADRFSLNPLKLVRNPAVFFGLMGYGLAVILGLIALKAGELSVIYPMVSFVHVLVPLFSVWFLKEKMNFWKWSGIGLIIAGVSAIGLGSA
jgi:multidrug transporter EmrE-like cation transporter